MKGLTPESDKLPIYDENDAPHVAQRKRREWLQKGCWVIRIIPELIPDGPEKQKLNKKRASSVNNIKCSLERHFMYISRDFDEIHCSKDANPQATGSPVCTPESDEVFPSENGENSNDLDFTCDKSFHNLVLKSPREFLSTQHPFLSCVHTPGSSHPCVHTPQEDGVHPPSESQEPEHHRFKSSLKHFHRKSGSSERRFMYLYSWLGRLAHSKSSHRHNKSKTHECLIKPTKHAYTNSPLFLPDAYLKDHDILNPYPQRIPLGLVVSIDFGVASSTYQLLHRSQSWALMSIPPYLCWSIVVQYPNINPDDQKNTPQTVTLDFIACNADHVESWVMGLNGLIRLTPHRTLYTPRLFKQQLRLLRIEYRRQQQLQVLLWYTEILKDSSKLHYSNTLIEELLECLCRINYVCAHHLPNKKSSHEHSVSKDVELPCFCGVSQDNTALNGCSIFHTTTNSLEGCVCDTPLSYIQNSECRQTSTAYSNASTYQNNVSSGHVLTKLEDLCLPLNSPDRLFFNDDLKEKESFAEDANKKPSILNGKFCLICSLFNTKQDSTFESSVHFYPALPLLGGCICCSLYSNLVRPKTFLNFQGSSAEHAFYDSHYIKSAIYDCVNDISSPSSVLCLSPRDDIDSASEGEKSGDHVEAYFKSMRISKDHIFDYKSNRFNDSKASLLSQSTLAASSCDSLSMHLENSMHWPNDKSIKTISSSTTLDLSSDEIVVFDPHCDITV